MLKAQNKTGLVFFPAFDWAISPTHPEREERLLYTQDQIFEEGLYDIAGITELKPEPVSLQDVQRVHFCVPDVRQVTTESHFISAGGAKTIGMAVIVPKRSGLTTMLTAVSYIRIGQIGECWHQESDLRLRCGTSRSDKERNIIRFTLDS